MNVKFITTIFKIQTHSTSQFLIATCFTCSIYHSGDRSLFLSHLDEEQSDVYHLLFDMNCIKRVRPYPGLLGIFRRKPFCQSQELSHCLYHKMKKQRWWNIVFPKSLLGQWLATNVSRLKLYMWHVMKGRAKTGIWGLYYLMGLWSSKCSIKSMTKWPEEDVSFLYIDLTLSLVSRFLCCWPRTPSPLSILHPSGCMTLVLHGLSLTSPPLKYAIYAGLLSIWLRCLSSVFLLLSHNALLIPHCSY